MVSYTWHGERLKARRKMLGLTTEELAKKTGTQHSHITAWEKDRSKPSGSYLVALCEVMRIEPKTLYECQDEKM